MRSIKEVVLDLHKAWGDLLYALDAQGPMHCDHEHKQLASIEEELQRDHDIVFPTWEEADALRKAEEDARWAEIMKTDTETGG